MPPKKKDISNRKQREVLTKLQEKGYSHGENLDPKIRPKVARKPRRGKSKEPEVKPRRRYKPGMRPVVARTTPETGISRRAASEDNVNLNSSTNRPQGYYMDSSPQSSRSFGSSNTSSNISSSSSSSSNSAYSTLSPVPPSSNSTPAKPQGSSLDDHQTSIDLMNAKMELKGTKIDFDSSLSVDEGFNKNEVILEDDEEDDNIKVNTAMKPKIGSKARTNKVMNSSSSFRSATMNDVNVSTSHDKTNNRNQKAEQQKHMSHLVPLGESVRMAYEKTKDRRWLTALNGELPETTFKVRDFGYAQSKLKVPSSEAMYEAAGGDCTMSGGPICNFASNVQLPDLGCEYEAGNVLPQYFIVNLQVPMVAKALFGGGGKKNKGKGESTKPTINAVYYFKISKNTAQCAKQLDSKNVRGSSPALRLFHHWCKNAHQDKLLSGRFKAIGFGFNFDDVGAPSFIKSYNGKPVLFAAGGNKPEKRQGFVNIIKGPNYIEIDVDMAQHFSYLAQRGIAWGMGKSEKLDLALAFLIEGRGDEELPEAVIGCSVNRFVPVLSAIDHDDVFSPLLPLSTALGLPPQYNMNKEQPNQSRFEEQEQDLSKAMVETNQSNAKLCDSLLLTIDNKFGSTFSSIIVELFEDEKITSEADLHQCISESAGFADHFIAKAEGKLKQIQLKKLQEWFASMRCDIA